MNEVLASCWNNKSVQSPLTIGQNLISALRIINKMQWEFLGGRDENPAEQGLFVLINCYCLKENEGENHIKVIS